jgi:hypothetical protein
MLEAMEAWPLAVFIRESTSIFGYSLVLTLHAIGLGTAVGVGTFMAIRLLGGLRDIPLAVLHKLVPVMYFAFILNFLSGSALLVAAATKLAVMPAFLIKMFFVVLGMIITWRIDRTILTGPEANVPHAVPQSGRRLAYYSLAFWYLALIIGRLTAYPQLVERLLGI